MLHAVIVGVGLIGTSAMNSNSTSDCSEKFISQPADHFASSSNSFSMRYFSCGGEYGAGGPLFFYTGNESPVDAYVNNTGLMWENAREFKALLIFAEHRYYGKSSVFPDCGNDSMRFLQAEQAMADYARLIAMAAHTWEFQKVIVFGGSYGGMLSAYMRMRYPQLVTGAIAASAPVLSLVGLEPDEFAFNAIIAADAGVECSGKIQDAFEIFANLSGSATGRARLRSLFKTCHKLETSKDAEGLRAYLADAWGTFAMGNYPYPSSYLTDAVSKDGESAQLPAYPMQVACSKLNDARDPVSLLQGLREAVGIWYNVTGSLKCFYPRPSSKIETIKSSQCGDWDYQYCAEFTMPFGTRSESDFFYPPTKFNLTQANQNCLERFNVTVSIDEPVLRYGGQSGLEQTSNIFFSNGDFDPWSAFGVDCAKVKCGRDVTSMMIEGGAHHLDLMFSNPADPDSVTEVRLAQVNAIRRWIGEPTSQTYDNTVEVLLS